ncbi:hypothetical protein PEX1_005650 [Penicillium expansum]|uniref:non-specific serine/threonine protein kinase n=1 Tax=Penicillium expansum TaxID=27334 RepID=A0A0A2J4I2_PENEN|nr:hypothetical protein PEX2_027940 [Penicillium expansum]KGO46474.1 hypothetical protein PEXP_066430 [Penicillium expansum]KGO49326.1 hypothetical protein PEX1_005650 [Penicillium expansum]KGO50229.1 hypothetical protein PEX2_027940 [Penicillium expansum]
MSHPRSRSPSVPSEGEIVESGPETKATASKPPLNGTSVDRPTRASPSSAPRSPASLKGTRSPLRQRSRTRSLSRSRSRSPYRENKTHKRSHDDLPESYDGGYDRRPRYEPPRHYRSRYDDRRRDRPASNRRPNSYYDYDREETHGEGLRYSDDYDRHDRHKDKRQRTRSRSRSPYRESRKPKQYSGDEFDSNVVNARSSADTGRRLPTEQLVRERGKASVVAQDLKLGAEKQKNQVQASSNLQAHVADEYVYSVTEEEERATNIHPRETTPNQDIAQEPELAEPINEADALEARRKRREAIRAKHRSQATPLHLKALNVSEVETDSSTPGTEPTSAKETSGEFLLDKLSLASTKLTPINSIDSPRASPFEQPGEAFPGSIGKDMDMINSNAPVGGTDKDGPSAADYDPTLDTKEERQKHGNVQDGRDEISSAAYDETKTVKQDILLPDAAPAPPPKTEAFDMFADDDDDMFAEEVPDAKPVHASATAVPQGKELDISMMDNWDDSEGYYAVRLGELINGRYHVHQNLGKGMFSSVVRATDTQTGGLVAVKIIRQNAIMRKAGMKEIGILEQLQEADPESKMHLIKFDRYFEHKGHLCMVFENLSMDLREVLKKFGRDVGLNLRAVRAYGQQIFLGLCLLRRCNILHADLKPDNLLVNEQRNILKVCDLGSASPASDNEITPYLVSRFYRAPEIILGIPYDYAIDVWSIGCTLFELYTGKILFTGRNNNQMLRSIMECRGKYPPKLLRRGSLAPHHFDEMLNFHSVEEDKITGRLHTKIVDFKKPTRDLKSRLMAQGTRGMPDAEVKDLTMFLDLLDRCLSLNPEKRITPAEALKHPFLAPRL